MKQTIILIFTTFFISCTENQRAKNFGGSAKIELEPNQKLVTATWKDDDFWYLTRPMKESDSPEVYVFKEQSSFGIMSGEYSIFETKTNYPAKVDTIKTPVKIILPQ